MIVFSTSLFLQLIQCVFKFILDSIFPIRKMPQFMAVGFLRVDRIRSRIDEKKKLISGSFTNYDDPEPPKFNFYLDFKQKDQLNCYLQNESKRDVYVRKLKVEMWDTATTEKIIVKELPDEDSDPPGNLTADETAVGWDCFCNLGNLGPESSLDFSAPKTEWNVTCEVVYDGVFVEADFFTQETSSRKGLLYDLSTHMLAMLDSTEDADITFVMEQEEVVAHKVRFQFILFSGYSRRCL